jgi:hypothetical protein
LDWEQAAWDLFLCLRTQWRYRNEVTGHTEFGQPIITSVPSGLDYTPAIAMLQAEGYEVAQGVEWLQVIEIEVLRKD